MARLPRKRQGRPSSRGGWQRPSLHASCALPPRQVRKGLRMISTLLPAIRLMRVVRFLQRGCACDRPLRHLSAVTTFGQALSLGGVHGVFATIDMCLLALYISPADCRFFIPFSFFVLPSLPRAYLALLHIKSRRRCN